MIVSWPKHSTPSLFHFTVKTPQQKLLDGLSLLLPKFAKSPSAQQVPNVVFPLSSMLPPLPEGTLRVWLPWKQGGLTVWLRKHWQTDWIQSRNHLHVCIYIYMRVVLNSFMWKTQSSPEKIIFRQTLANPTFIFSGACWPRLVRRTWMCDILKFVPGFWSIVTLHSVAAAPKHLRSALRCCTFTGQFWHNKSTVWAT